MKIGKHSPFLSPNLQRYQFFGFFRDFDIHFGKWKKMSKSGASPRPSGKIEAVNDIISSALQTVLIRAWVKMILMLLNQMRMPPFLILASIMTQL